MKSLGSLVASLDIRSAKPGAKTVDPFYQSPEWRQLMAQIIKRRGRRCEDPKHDPTTPRHGVRIFGDHIIERKDGGAELDPGNIMLRCGACHSTKTSQSRAARMKG